MIEGRLPAALRGRDFRNGPGRCSAPASLNTANTSVLVQGERLYALRERWQRLRARPGDAGHARCQDLVARTARHAVLGASQGRGSDKADLSRQRVFEMPAARVCHFGMPGTTAACCAWDCVESVPLPAFNAASEQMMRGQRTARDVSTPRVLEIDLPAGRLRMASRDEAVEFPGVDPRVVAQRHRFVWYPRPSTWASAGASTA